MIESQRIRIKEIKPLDPFFFTLKSTLTFLHENKVVPDFLKSERKKQVKNEEKVIDFVLAEYEELRFVGYIEGPTFF